MDSGSRIGPYEVTARAGEGGMGDVTRSRKAYEGFFAFWKNADLDVPVLIAARREYSQLAVK